MSGVGIAADSAAAAVVGLVVVADVRGGHHCHWTGNSSTFY